MGLRIETIKKQSQFWITDLYRWSPNVDFQFSCGPYDLKLAKTKDEVLECFKLRYEIFYEELAGTQKISRLDYDTYDNHCDHLIIVDRPTNKVVGTYRLNCSKFSDTFYTTSEFQIEEWLKSQTDTFLELGRACIHKDHRRGIVMSLLWKGIAEYMQATRAEKLIGCSSVKYINSKTAAMIFKYLEETNSLAKEIVKPQASYNIPDFIFWLLCCNEGLTLNQFKEVEAMIPALLKSYLKAGAKVLSYPAHDRDMKCLDFVTVLDWKDLDQKLVKKFF